MSASQRRRDQRQRSAVSGGGSLADERSQLIVEQRRATPTEEHHNRAASRNDAGASQAPRRDRAAITWLAQPVALGPGSRIVGYDRVLVPGWLAERMGAIETPNAAEGKA